MRPYALLKNDRPVDLLDYLREVQRVDSHTVRDAAKEMLEVSRLLEFVANDDPALAPCPGRDRRMPTFLLALPCRLQL